MKKNRLLIVSIAIFLLGSGALALSLSANKTADAAASNTWTETWAITKWHNQTNQFGLYQHPKTLAAGQWWDDPLNVSLGPSEWTVTGTIGGTSYVETYNVTDWEKSVRNLDTAPNAGAFNCAETTTKPTMTINKSQACIFNFSDGSYYGNKTTSVWGTGTGWYVGPNYLTVTSEYNSHTDGDRVTSTGYVPGWDNTAFVAYGIDAMFYPKAYSIKGCTYVTGAVACTP